MSLAEQVDTFARKVFRIFETDLPNTDPGKVLCEESTHFPAHPITVYVRASKSRSREAMYVHAEIEVRSETNTILLSMPQVRWAHGERPWILYKKYPSLAIRAIESVVHVLLGIPTSTKPPLRCSGLPNTRPDGVKGYTYPSGTMWVQPVAFEFRATAQHIVLTCSNLHVHTEAHHHEMREVQSLFDQIVWTTEKAYFYDRPDTTPQFIECSEELKRAHAMIAEHVLLGCSALDLSKDSL